MPAIEVALMRQHPHRPDVSAGGKVVQRQVLYLGEINDSQHEA
ncbi:hypothetical protein MesoLjLc_10050 [Mesorhizobium sp. L-8-10]|nr:hypothetical protein MesoLjLc_10050 [Mesorhizobium sp. L-8-10]